MDASSQTIRQKTHGTFVVGIDDVFPDSSASHPLNMVGLEALYPSTRKWEAPGQTPGAPQTTTPAVLVPHLRSAPTMVESFPIHRFLFPLVLRYLLRLQLLADSRYQLILPIAVTDKNVPS